MRIHIDPEQDAMYIRFTDEPYASSEEVQDDVILDRDESGAIGDIEFLNVSTRIPHLDPSNIKLKVENGSS